MSPKALFEVKICGITSIDDARLAVEAGADALGLNFYARSPRCIAYEQAAEIARVVPSGVVKVGLFVDAAAAEICRALAVVGFDAIQLHGGEPPERLAEIAVLSELAHLPVIRAFRLGAAGLAPIAGYLSECSRLDCTPQMVLLDAHVSGEFGGTGQTTDWAAAREFRDHSAWPAVVLAGGLTHENVAAAIRQVQPAAVDTASGVEAAPGRKDPAKVAAFVQAARKALAESRRAAGSD